MPRYGIHSSKWRKNRAISTFSSSRKPTVTPSTMWTTVLAGNSTWYVHSRGTMRHIIDRYSAMKRYPRPRCSHMAHRGALLVRVALSNGYPHRWYIKIVAAKPTIRNSDAKVTVAGIAMPVASATSRITQCLCPP
ncbi:MAG: hypothetical protein R3B06_24580 [Kofleriaceae bacterium]